MVKIMNQSENITLEKIDVKLPSLYKVIFFNDDVTPMGFVVEVLCNVFKKTKEDAIRLMLEIHNSGSGVAGVYIKSIAESKVTMVREISIKANYPLTVTMEKED
jgi:ATP-dependent Clp protease adaptor protein ClpS